MEKSISLPDPDDVNYQLFLHARAIQETVSVLRRAQGKVNPSELLEQSPEWYAALESFGYDIQRGFGIEACFTIGRKIST
jgi:hypothetical protein